MFYHNTKFHFKLKDGSPEDIPGAVLCVSAMPVFQLQRRNMGDHSHLQHRLIDPQVYLADLDPKRSGRYVTNLASYPWFPEADVPEFDSGKHKIYPFRSEHEAEYHMAWQDDATSIDKSKAIRACVEFQQSLECDVVVLPCPLTSTGGGDFQEERGWIDEGIKTASELNVNRPLYASLAVRDAVFEAAKPQGNRLLHIIADQLTARDALDGVYLVPERLSEEGYYIRSEKTLRGIIWLLDCLVRGSGKRVVVNFMGCFGAIANAVGAEVWASGYYRSQRRLKLADLTDQRGSAVPRYFSPQLLGDVDLEGDLETIASSELRERVLYDTPPSNLLHDALREGKSVSNVPQWEYGRQNITASTAHYLWSMRDTARHLEKLGPKKRRVFVHRWLRSAKSRAQAVAELLDGDYDPYKTTIEHQSTWLKVYEDWLENL